MTNAYILVVLLYLPGGDFIEAGNTITRAASYGSIKECEAAKEALRPELSRQAVQLMLDKGSDRPPKMSAACLPDLASARPGRLSRGTTVGQRVG